MGTQSTLKDLKAELDQINNQLQQLMKENEIIKASERKFRSFVENSNNFIQTVDQNGIIKYVNYVIHELKLEDVIDHSIFEFLDRDYREKYQENINIAFTGKNTILETKNTFGNYYLNHFVPLAANNEEIMIIAIDITDRTKAEIKLKDSEEKFRNYVETSQDLMWECDAEGKFTYLNPAWKGVVGFTHDEMLGHAFSEFILPEEVEKSIEEFTLHLAGGGVKGFPSTYISKSGEIIHLLFNAIPLKNKEGIIIGTQGTAYDVTELNLTQSSLSESEKRYRQLFENLPIAVLEMDFSVAKNYLEDLQLDTSILTHSYFDENLDLIKECIKRVTIINSNQAVIDLYKIRNNSELENLGKTFTEKTFRSFAKILCDIFQDNTPTENETEFVGFDGIKRNILIRLTIPPGFNKSLGRVLVTIIDITERKLFEAEMIKSSKLESLGILAGGIAHDFNNLLTGVSGNISIALRKSSDPSVRETYLREAELALQRASKLTNQLLTFSKGGIPSMEMVDIKKLIKESTRFTLRGSNVRYRLVVDNDLWIVEIDSGQIAQVIQNVVLNAAQAMVEGGIIRITARNISIDENQVHELKAGSYVCIRMKDNGIGIAEDNLHKIFDPFFTTKADGTGLGLTTSYSIVKNHDGRIIIESKVDDGTTVTIYLPALPEAETVETAKTATSSEVSGNMVDQKNSGHILVMDDEPTVQKVFRGMFQELGYTVVVVPDGKSAISMYETALASNHPFDLVVLDLTISGGMGGKETITHLQSVHPEIKAIVTSGYSNDPIFANYEKYGFQGKLAKPFTFEILEEVLNSIDL